MLTKTANQAMLERFLYNVATGPGCHLWQGFLNADGYGMFKAGLPTTKYAHRWHWIAVNGPFEARLTVDHICRNRACVRLDHLQLLPRGQNALIGFGPPAENARRVLGRCGHPLTQITATERRCVPCNREWHRLAMRRRRAAAKALQETT